MQLIRNLQGQTELCVTRHVRHRWEVGDGWKRGGNEGG